MRRFEERLYSLEEYLAMERQSSEKHEYFQGRIYLMAGGSPNHSLIASNLNRLLGNALEDRPCRVYTSDLQVLVKANGLVTYPDVSVVCGPVEYAKSSGNLVTNPNLIVEVLSPTTSGYDQTTKFNLYKGLETLEDYLLVDSRSVNVIYYHKVGVNQWMQQTYNRLDETVEIKSQDVELALASIYSKVDFDSEPLPLR